MVSRATTQIMIGLFVAGAVAVPSPARAVVSGEFVLKRCGIKGVAVGIWACFPMSGYG